VRDQAQQARERVSATNGASTNGATSVDPYATGGADDTRQY
jgi:hypothetical protein